MDLVVSNLVNLGIGGLMAAAVLLVLWQLVRITIPEMIREHRQCLAEQAAHYRQLMERLIEELISRRKGE